MEFSDIFARKKDLLIAMSEKSIAYLFGPGEVPRGLPSPVNVSIISYDIYPLRIGCPSRWRAIGSSREDACNVAQVIPEPAACSRPETNTALVTYFIHLQPRWFNLCHKFAALATLASQHGLDIAPEKRDHLPSPLCWNAGTLWGNLLPLLNWTAASGAFCCTAASGEVDSHPLLLCQTVRSQGTWTTFRVFVGGWLSDEAFGINYNDDDVRHEPVDSYFCFHLWGNDERKQINWMAM